jgi:hypothetical protein
MDSRPTGLAIRALAALAVATTTLVLPPRNDETKTADQIAGPSSAAPIVVAQGRCFNGRCY